MGDTPPPPASLPDAPAAADSTVPGRITYVALCAGCHGLNGEGVPNTVVALRGNTTLRLADPRNLIVSMLDGIRAQNFPYLQSMQAMPGFADKLSDEQAAELANYLRVSFGGQKRRRDADRGPRTALSRHRRAKQTPYQPHVTRLVSQFRSSPYFAARSDANFGIEGTLANL